MLINHEYKKLNHEYKNLNHEYKNLNHEYKNLNHKCPCSSIHYIASYIPLHSIISEVFGYVNSRNKSVRKLRSNIINFFTLPIKNASI